MNILIDICHPAHVHLFKNLYESLVRNDHKVIVTVRDIPSATELLRNLNIPYTLIGEKYDSWLKKAFQQFKYLIALKKVAKQNKIKVAIGTSINIAHLSLISKVTSVVLDDDDDDLEPLFVKFGHPFADYLLTPDSIIMNRRRKKRTIFHPSTHECAYLHPDRFVPNLNIKNELGIHNERFFILRFNAFKAHHDISHSGINLKQKRELVELLSKHGRVIITTEGKLDQQFEQYQIKISPERIHHALYYSDLYVGDSQTMTTEAAILGTPAFKCNTFAGLLSVPNEVENKYGLCFSFQPEEFKKMVSIISATLEDQDAKQKWAQKRQAFFKDKIDLTDFLVWFVQQVHNNKTYNFDVTNWADFK
ncbi:DUF354 domain-containing protein [Ignavibacteriales bacterium]